MPPLKDLLIVIALGALIFEAIRNPTNAIVTYLVMQAKKALGWTEREVVALPGQVEGLFHKASPVAAPVPPPAVNVTVNHAPVTVTFGGGTNGLPPAGTITTPPAKATMNGVPTPDGMTDAQFVSLVVALQGVLSMVGNANVHAALVASSQGWWNGLGAYFREELLSQSTGDTLTALTALSTAAGAPALLPITAAQQTAALAAVNAVAPPKP